MIEPTFIHIFLGTLKWLSLLMGGGMMAVFLIEKSRSALTSFSTLLYLLLSFVMMSVDIAIFIYMCSKLF